MTLFLVVAALLMAATLALLLRPWWWRSRVSNRSRQALNAAIYRDQLAELEADRGNGQLNDADYQEARGELQRRLLEDTAEAEATVTAAPRPWRSLATLLVLLPLAAAGLYAWLGSPAGMDRMARRDFSRDDIEQMVAGLAAKLEKEPENLQGWVMLARSYKAMRRHDQAERAYEKGFALVQQDPQLLADYADLLGSKAGGRLEGRPEQLIAQALALDPNHMQSLWLAGTAAFTRKDFAKAAGYWQRAQSQLEPGSEDAQMLASIIAEARQKQAAAKTAAASAISGRVDLAASVKDKAAADYTVFVLAKEADQPMPLAVLRARVADLPMDFRLDDTDALTPDRALSSAKSVLVEARVSKSGNATPQPGDLKGRSGAVKPGAKGLRVSIDQVVE